MLEHPDQKAVENSSPIPVKGGGWEYVSERIVCSDVQIRGF